MQGKLGGKSSAVSNLKFVIENSPNTAAFILTTFCGGGSGVYWENLLVPELIDFLGLGKDSKSKVSLFSNIPPNCVAGVLAPAWSFGKKFTPSYVKQHGYDYPGPYSPLKDWHQLFGLNNKQPSIPVAPMIGGLNPEVDVSAHSVTIGATSCWRALTCCCCCGSTLRR